MDRHVPSANQETQGGESNTETHRQTDTIHASAAGRGLCSAHLQKRRLKALQEEIPANTKQKQGLLLTHETPLYACAGRRTHLGSLRRSLQAPGIEPRPSVALLIAPLGVVGAAAAAAATAATAGRSGAAHCLVKRCLPGLGAKQAAWLEHWSFAEGGRFCLRGSFVPVRPS